MRACIAILVQQAMSTETAWHACSDAAAHRAKTDAGCPCRAMLHKKEILLTPISEDSQGLGATSVALSTLPSCSGTTEGAASAVLLAEGLQRKLLRRLAVQLRTPPGLPFAGASCIRPSRSSSGMPLASASASPSTWASTVHCCSLQPQACPPRSPVMQLA